MSADIDVITTWIANDRRAQRLVDRIKLTGGATWTWRGPKTPTTGYMVSVPGAEEITRTDEFGTHHILSYEERTLLGPDQYYGAWVNDGHVYLDKSVHMESLTAALLLARDSDQLAIYDIANDVSIETGLERTA